MNNILLLEPDYDSTYPPLGLMKLAYYHKDCRGDFVWLAKGKLPRGVSEKVKGKLANSKYYAARYDLNEFVGNANDVIQNRRWDRVYVTSLFTYEWDKTIAAIEYAKTLVDDVSKVFIGGILATLIPDELEAATGIRHMTGLLTDSSVLGYSDKVNIDLLTPDYSILDLVEYRYPMSEHYILSATRGCGMKCSFCAVQKLEPDCVDYLPVKLVVAEIDAKYGARKNLVLMDNNILKSRHFHRIMQDIADMGYGKGATKINPWTGKVIQIFVDFNQGLDMNFITERKMEALSHLAIRPIRIAFDHIDDAEKYIAGMRLADRYGIQYMSNYMLYNAAEFKGKGKTKAADTPKDLYNRLRINVNLQEEFNARRRHQGMRLAVIYSFPMRYTPLSSRDRSYVGTHWTPKMIRAFQQMVISAGGAVRSGKECFERVFGKSHEEFYAMLQAPALYHKKRHRHNNECWTRVWRAWEGLYRSLSEEDRRSFEHLIARNVFSAETYLTLKSPALRKLYVHYIHKTKLLEFLHEVKRTNLARFYEMQDYICRACPDLLTVNMELLGELKQAEFYQAELMMLFYTDLRMAA